MYIYELYLLYTHIYRQLYCFIKEYNTWYYCKSYKRLARDINKVNREFASNTKCFRLWDARSHISQQTENKIICTTLKDKKLNN